MRGQHSTVFVFAGVAVVLAAGCGDEGCPEAVAGLCVGAFDGLGLPRVEDAVALDVDGDGVDEVVMIERGEPRLAIGWADGRMLTYPLDFGPAAVAGGDLDGDGRPEVVLLDTEAGAIEVIEIDASGAVTPRETIEVGEAPRDLWVGDLDGDARAEVITVQLADRTIAVVHGGDAAIETFAVGSAPVGLDLGDLDGDGLLDVVVADPVDGALHVLLGESGGRFTPPLPTPAVPGVSQVDLGDIDGDGDLDAVSRGDLGELWLSPGDGAGGLGGGVAIPTGWGRASGVAVVPAGPGITGGVMALEGGAPTTWLVDGALAPAGRILGAGLRRPFSMIRRRGGPLFAGVDGGALRLDFDDGPALVEVWRRPGLDFQEGWGALALGDIDGDGHVDIACEHWFLSHQADDDPALHLTLETFRGDGLGGFSAASITGIGPADTLALGDVDGDGLLDAIGGHPGAVWVSARGFVDPVDLALDPSATWSVLGVLPWPARDQVLVRGIFDGSEIFQAVTLDDALAVTSTTVLESEHHVDAADVVDLDGDGDLDLVAWLVADQQLSLRAWFRDGDAMIPGPRHDLATLTGQPRVEVVDARGVGDAAGDGIADVLVVQGEILARIRGLDGDVPVIIAQALPGVVAWAGAGRLHAHDLDGDDAPDLLYDGDQGAVVLHGDAGGFESSWTPLPTPLDNNREVADVDGDGRLDLITAGLRGLSVLRSETRPRPVASALWGRVRSRYRNVGLADVDGDDRLEIVTADVDGIDLALEAGPRFRSVYTPLPGLGGGAAADLDRDGRDELLFWRVNGPELVAVRWDGAALQDEVLEIPGADPNHRWAGVVVSGDLDGDGHADLVGYRGGVDELALVVAYGDGGGRFGAFAPIVAELPHYLVLADLNGDDLLEIVRFAGDGATIAWGRPDRSWGASKLPLDAGLVHEGDLVIHRGSGLLRVSARGEDLEAPRSLAEDPRLEGSYTIGGGDLDGDGRGDLVTVHAEDNELLLWLTRGDAIELVTTLEYSGQYAFGLADVDGGGRADLLYYGPSSTGVRWGGGAAVRRGSIMVFAVALGCGPDVETIQGEHLDYSWEIGLEPCAGNAARMDRIVAFYAGELGLDVAGFDRIEYTWLTPDGYEAVAVTKLNKRAWGFAYGNNAFGKDPTIDHEIAHTVADQRGSTGTPFLEEGLAVALDPRSNDGARHSREDPRPFVALRRNDDPAENDPLYRAGGAFVSYLLSRHGPSKLLELRDRLGGRSSEAEFARDFEGVYGRPLADEVDKYLQAEACPEDASASPRLFGCSTPTIPWMDAERWVHTTAIDCDEPSFSGDRARRVFTEVTVEVPGDGVYRVNTFGDDGASVELASCGPCPWLAEDLTLGAGEIPVDKILKAGLYTVKISGRHNKIAGLVLTPIGGASP